LLYPRELTRKKKGNDKGLRQHVWGGIYDSSKEFFVSKSRVREWGVSWKITHSVSECKGRKVEKKSNLRYLQAYEGKKRGVRRGAFSFWGRSRCPTDLLNERWGPLSKKRETAGRV